MGGAVISFGLSVLLVCILRIPNAVVADPIPDPAPAPAPAHYDICTYMVKHGKERRGSTTTPAPEEKPKDEKKEKIELFSNLLRELLDLEKEEEKKKEEEEKKKKEEEEKKKNEEDAKKKDDKDESRGFRNIDDFWNSYIKFLTALYYSF